MQKTLVAIALLLAASCAPAPNAYVFRNDDRPSYSKTATVDELKSLNPDSATIIDVRLSEDFAASPAMIPGAIRRDPDAIADWVNQLPKDKPVVVYCVKGKWVSQKAASYLSEHGFDVRSLEGGINAWDAEASVPAK